MIAVILFLISGRCADSQLLQRVFRRVEQIRWNHHFHCQQCFVCWCYSGPYRSQKGTHFSQALQAALHFGKGFLSQRSEDCWKAAGVKRLSRQFSILPYHPARKRNTCGAIFPLRQGQITWVSVALFKNFGSTKRYAKNAERDIFLPKVHGRSARPKESVRQSVWEHGEELQGVHWKRMIGKYKRKND